jgi:S1-C subfamily serine protease
MKRAFPVGAMALTLLSLPSPCEAQVSRREIITRSKAATAFVEVVHPRGKDFGSAFCVDEPGLFITNAHVVKAAKLEGPVKLVLHAGEEDQRIVTAKLYRLDTTSDLALLTCERVESLVPLPLGRDEDLFETLETTVCGYPFGPALALEKDGYPNISVNMHRISRLKKDKGSLVIVQFDGQLNPGDSGAPVLSPTAVR